MPKDMHFDATVHATDGHVMLPGSDVIADAQFAREGADLFLTSPDGHTVKVEGYFSHNPPPSLDTPDGKHLSPDLVSAFLAPQHPAQYADAGHHAAAADDSSAVGKITQVVGKAEVIHADGSHAPAALNAAIHQGDVIQTADKGGVNILFSDNTTFAISENARMSVDEFNYHPADHSGSTFFSVLQGVFVYTSGLIGKHDPGHVNINTPVGAIGIRGTVVAGDIHPAGQDSHITIVDGAIVVTNDGGSLLLDQNLDTAVLNDYASAPLDGGQMTAQAFSTTYDAAHSVASGTFDAVSTGVYQSAPVAAPDATVNHDGTTTAPTDNTAPSTTAPGDTTAPLDHGTTAPAPSDGLLMPGDVFTDPSVTQAGASTASFTTDMTGSSFTTDTTGSSFATTGGATSAATLGGATLLSTTSSSGTLAAATGGAATPTTSAASLTPHLNFTFESWYQADGGVPLLYENLSSLAATPDPGFQVGHIDTSLFPAGTTYSLTTGALNSLHYTGSTTTAVSSSTLLSVMSINPDGTVHIDNPFAMLPDVNGSSIAFTITATDAGGTVIDTQNYSLTLSSQYIHAPGFNGIQIGDNPGTAFSEVNVAPSMNNDPLIGGAGHDLLVGRDGNDTLVSNGGFDTLLGGGGTDKIVLTGGNTYEYINGGAVADNDKLQLGSSSDVSGLNFNFITSGHNVYNITSIDMDKNHSNTLTLSLQDVFDMVGPGGTLDISTGGGAQSQTVLLNGSDGTVLSNPTDTPGTPTTITATYNSSSVTLVIHNGDGAFGSISHTVV